MYQSSILVVKKIRFYNIFLLIECLFIRYKIFINERRRLFTTVFDIADITADHYILLKGSKKIGIARVIYKNNIAQLERIGILKECRSQGYGTELINQVISIIRRDNKINLISLLTRNDKVKFYNRFGFIEDRNIILNNVPLINMMVTIKR